ncbi:MAG: (2Fe-2S)-binding protein [Desulfobacterales bacterium]|nr:(2Fe-2S)-binding protein [Desulfobacterales bacterium]
MSKKIVCFCHDITETDLINTIEAGYDHIEMLKRFTGVFMGPCQGKMCMQNVLKIFARETGQPIESLRVPTLRPPAEPIPLGSLATETLRGDDDKE